MKDLREMDVFDSIHVGLNLSMIVVAFLLGMSLFAVGMALGELLSDVIVGPRRAVKVAVRDVPYQPEQPAKEAEG